MQVNNLDFNINERIENIYIINNEIINLIYEILNTLPNTNNTIINEIITNLEYANDFIENINSRIIQLKSLINDYFELINKETNSMFLLVDEINSVDSQLIVYYNKLDRINSTFINLQSLNLLNEQINQSAENYDLLLAKINMFIE